jgi:hypothetical protein
MSTSKPAIPLRMRLTAMILGMVFLFWIPFEDSSPTITLLLALALCAWGAVYFLIKTQSHLHRVLLRTILAGTLAGAAVTPLALFLLAFKTGLHGHQAPDFTPEQIFSVIYRGPIWLVGGFLIGLGSGIWMTTRQT